MGGEATYSLGVALSDLLRGAILVFLLFFQRVLLTSRALSLGVRMTLSIEKRHGSNLRANVRSCEVTQAHRLYILQCPPPEV